MRQGTRFWEGGNMEIREIRENKKQFLPLLLFYVLISGSEEDIRFLVTAADFFQLIFNFYPISISLPL